MRSLVLALASTLAVASAADVVPSCRARKVEARSPGEDCGFEGPRRELRCTAPAECLDVVEGGKQCSLPCSTDAECEPLGRKLFTCSGTLVYGGGRVCVLRRAPF